MAGAAHPSIRFFLQLGFVPNRRGTRTRPSDRPTVRPSDRPTVRPSDRPSRRQIVTRRLPRTRVPEKTSTTSASTQPLKPGHTIRLPRPSEKATSLTSLTPLHRPSARRARTPQHRAFRAQQGGTPPPPPRRPIRSDGHARDDGGNDCGFERVRPDRDY